MKTAQLAAITAHGDNLLRIFTKATERAPLTLCKRLRRLEREAAAIGLRLCNGPEYPNEDDTDKACEKVLNKVDAILHFRELGIPVFINRDPRGYALKIDSEWLRTIPKSMRNRFAPLCRDMGGYGIIAPEIK